MIICFGRWRLFLNLGQLTEKKLWIGYRLRRVIEIDKGRYGNGNKTDEVIGGPIKRG